MLSYTMVVRSVRTGTEQSLGPTRSPHAVVAPMESAMENSRSGELMQVGLQYMDWEG